MVRGALLHAHVAAVLCVAGFVREATPSPSLLGFGHCGSWAPSLRSARAGVGARSAAQGVRVLARGCGGAEGLQMIGDQANWANEGSRKRFWNEDPVAEALAGSWKIEWTQDDKKRSSVVNLLSDGRVAPPEDSEKTKTEKILQLQLPQAKGKAVLLFGTWRLKGEDVSIVIHKHTTSEGKKFGQATIMFQGMIRNETDCPYGSKVGGNVLEGESDPEWMGKFNLTQMVGKASLGLGPAGPTIKETRASSGFALGGRSDAKVLKRFSGSWDATITLDGSRCTASFDLLPNGTFVTTSYAKFADTGVETGGVLRGRWNVYYSEDTKKERFWMQVLRLKSTGVNLWQDLLFLGDIDVVDTWKDIQDILAKQIALSSSNVSATESPQLGDVNPDEDAGFELSNEAGMPTVYEDDLGSTPEDRGIFTSGKQRKYRFKGIIIAGHEFEPSIAGRCQFLQGKRQETETLERSE